MGKTYVVILNFAATPFTGDAEECQEYTNLVLGADLMVLTTGGEMLKVGTVVKAERFTSFEAVTWGL